MLKGINKQIIEIKCTNDEFFEKALLFVRGDKADLPRDILAEHSAALFAELSPHTDPPPRKNRRVFAALAALYAAGAVLFGALVYSGLRL